MGMTMNDCVIKGKTDVQEKLDEGIRDISKMGEEYREVREQLEDMPGSLDADIMDRILDAKNRGKEDAASDIESVKKSVIDKAAKLADSLQKDVSAKISDNHTAKSRLESITSKYGKDAISRAKTTIEGNTKTGEDLLKNLEKAVKNADQSVQKVKDSL